MLFHCFAFCYRDVTGDMMGYEDVGESRASLLKHVFKLSDIMKILEDRMSKVTQAIQSKIFADLQHMVSPIEIMDACDSAGVSRKGYEAIYRVFTLAHRLKGVVRPMLLTDRKSVV